MELLFLLLLLGGVLLLLQWLSNLGAPVDNREPYLRDESGEVLALYVAVPLILALLATTTGLILIGRLLLGGSWVVWLGAELLLAGAGSALALTRSRRAGIEHTPAGGERHEIDARTEVAKYAIDRHCEMVERLKGVRK